MHKAFQVGGMLRPHTLYVCCVFANFYFFIVMYFIFLVIVILCKFNSFFSSFVFVCVITSEQ